MVNKLAFGVIITLFLMFSIPQLGQSQQDLSQMVALLREMVVDREIRIEILTRQLQQAQSEIQALKK